MLQYFKKRNDAEVKKIQNIDFCKRTKLSYPIIELPNAPKYELNEKPLLLKNNPYSLHDTLPDTNVVDDMRRVHRSQIYYQITTCGLFPMNIMCAHNYLLDSCIRM